MLRAQLGFEKAAKTAFSNEKKTYNVPTQLVNADGGLLIVIPANCKTLSVGINSRLFRFHSKWFFSRKISARLYWSCFFMFSSTIPILAFANEKKIRY